MPATFANLAHLQRRVWSGSLPLSIRLAPGDCRSYDDAEAYLIQYPRLSYLAFLLPRLHAFFHPKLINPEVAAHDAWLEFEGVPLKWHYSLGLLYDLFSGAQPVVLDREQHDGQAEGAEGEGKQETLPWRLTVHFTDYPSDQLIQLDAEGRAMQDSWINAVKEADFIRNGTARAVMSLSKEDSDNIWRAVQAQDLDLFNSVNNKLLSPPGVTIKHVPMKIYLPTSAGHGAEQSIPEESEEGNNETKAGHIRVVQSLVPLQLPSKQPQTLGTALNGIIPTIFPSRRNPLLAQPVLHGVVVPMGANIESLGRMAAYSDGFLHIAVVMLG